MPQGTAPCPLQFYEGKIRRFPKNAQYFPLLIRVVEETSIYTAAVPINLKPAIKSKFNIR